MNVRWLEMFAPLYERNAGVPFTAYISRFAAPTVVCRRSWDAIVGSAILDEHIPAGEPARYVL